MLAWYQQRWRRWQIWQLWQRWRRWQMWQRWRMCRRCRASMIQHSRVFPGALLADYLMIRIICPHKPACNALCHKVHQLFPRLVAPFDFLSSSKPCCQIMLGDALASRWSRNDRTGASKKESMSLAFCTGTSSSINTTMSRKNNLALLSASSTHTTCSNRAKLMYVILLSLVRTLHLPNGTKSSCNSSRRGAPFSCTKSSVK